MLFKKISKIRLPNWAQGYRTERGIPYQTVLLEIKLELNGQLNQALKMEALDLQRYLHHCIKLFIHNLPPFDTKLEKNSQNIIIRMCRYLHILNLWMCKVICIWPQRSKIVPKKNSSYELSKRNRNGAYTWATSIVFYWWFQWVGGTARRKYYR